MGETAFETTAGLVGVKEALALGQITADEAVALGEITAEEAASVAANNVVSEVAEVAPKVADSAASSMVDAAELSNVAGPEAVDSAANSMVDAAELTNVAGPEAVDSAASSMVDAADMSNAAESEIIDSAESMANPPDLNSVKEPEPNLWDALEPLESPAELERPPLSEPALEEDPSLSLPDDAPEEAPISQYDGMDENYYWRSRWEGKPWTYKSNDPVKATRMRLKDTLRGEVKGHKEQALKMQKGYNRPSEMPLDRRVKWERLRKGYPKDKPMTPSEVFREAMYKDLIVDDGYKDAATAAREAATEERHWLFQHPGKTKMPLAESKVIRPKVSPEELAEVKEIVPRIKTPPLEPITPEDSAMEATFEQLASSKPIPDGYEPGLEGLEGIANPAESFDILHERILAKEAAMAAHEAPVAETAEIAPEIIEFSRAHNEPATWSNAATEASDAFEEAAIEKAISDMPAANAPAKAKESWWNANEDFVKTLAKYTGITLVTGGTSIGVPVGLKYSKYSTLARSRISGLIQLAQGRSQMTRREATANATSPLKRGTRTRTKCQPSPQ